MRGDDNRIHTILMTTDTLGGVWTYALELSRALQSYNTHVHLAVMGPELSSDQEQEIAAIANIDVHHRNYKLEWMPDSWQDVDEAGEWLLDLERKIEPDIIHLHSYSHASMDWQSPVIVTAHSDVYSWHRHVLGELPSEEWKTYYERVTAGLEAADCVVVISQCVKKDLNRHFKFKTSQKLIYNGLRASPYYRTQKKPMILSMGRAWDRAKNFRVLDDAAFNCIWPVRIAGRDVDPVSGERTELKKVEFTGHLSREQVQQQLSEAMVYCHPAIYEPFGLAPLEAALSGCALLLSDVPSMREIWEDAAFYFDPTDSEGLRGRIMRITADPDTITDMARRARQRARLFSARLMGNRYHHLYCEVLQQTPRKILKSPLAYED